MNKIVKNSGITKFLVLTVFLIIAITSVVSAKEVCELYDDFSSGTLNSEKWTESTFNGDPLTDEHYVNTTTGIYYLAQNSELDAQTNLEPNIEFKEGESFSYELIYYNGSGNHQSRPLINENYPPSQLEICNFTTAGCGAIGYWDDYPDLGAQNGTYKIKFDFSSNQVKMTATRPDNITIVNTFTGNSEPYNLKINTHTGANGLIRVGLDNFSFCKNIPEVSLSTPEDKSVLSETSLNLTFSVNSSVLIQTCYVYLDDITQLSTDYFEASDLTLGIHTWNVTCTDNSDHEGYSESRSFWVAQDKSNVSGYYIKNTYGTINWTVSLNLSENFGQYVNISNNRIEINSSAAPNLNKNARITFTNLSWSNPRILKNSLPCNLEECNTVQYNSTTGEFIFDVTGFSVYTTDETPVLFADGGRIGNSGGGGGAGTGRINLSVISGPQTNSILNSSLENSTPTENAASEIQTSPITGAAIGTTVKRYWVPALVFVLIIAGLLITLRMRKKVRFKSSKLFKIKIRT